MDHNKWLHQPSSPHELIAKVAPNISTQFLFPFGCPATSIPPTQCDWKYAAFGEFGIAVADWCVKCEMSWDMVDRCCGDNAGLCELELECPNVVANKRFYTATRYED